MYGITVNITGLSNNLTNNVYRILIALKRIINMTQEANPFSGQLLLETSWTGHE
jgi:hypothetical protein